MTARTEQLKDTLLAIEPELCPERARLFTASWRETEGEPIPIRRARAFAKVLREMSIYIRPDELIVGNQAAKPRSAPFFPEYAVDWLDREMEDLASRPVDRFLVSDEAKAALREVIAYWRGQTHNDLVKSLTHHALPEEALPAFDFDAFILDEAVSNLSRTNGGDGHLVAAYDRVMRVGLGGIVAEAKELMAELDLTKPENLEKKLFYESVVTALEAVLDFAERYAKLAEQQAARETNAVRRGELEKVAEVCRRVPAHPARNLWEAVQTYWFVHLLIHVEADGHSIGPGRLDQYLYPYYEADLAAGLINREQAVELVECFLLKCCELNKIREWGLTRNLSGYPLFQTITIGGQTREGLDATNEMSYICLEATGNLKLPQPTTVVRVHDGTPEEFLQAAARCVVRHGGGMPGFFSDEVAIPSLMSVGVSLEDARDWVIMGCSELQVGGKFNTATGGLSHVNLLKFLELALYGGTNPNTGVSFAPTGGDLSTYRTFDEVVAAFRAQMAAHLRLVPVLDSVTCYTYAKLSPTPFLSAVLDYRLAVGKDVSQGGGPNYNHIMSLGMGLANVANALAALKKLVFEEKLLAGAEVLEAMRGNFAGPRGEEIRQMLLNRAPKYGNDDDYVDVLAKQVFRDFCREISQYKPARGGYYSATFQSLTANVPYGQRVGATPDGRRASEPLADNVSPTAGSDANGPTAVLKSVAKLDHALATTGTILNLKFHPSALEGEDRLRKFASLIRSFVDLKGFQVQFNIISADILREAQAHPERYRNLVVKVAGYSAFFATLDRKLQDQLIERTTHYLG
ncbi:MAG: glycyl radical protein [Chloroflexota bacterium]